MNNGTVGSLTKAQKNEIFSFPPAVIPKPEAALRRIGVGGIITRRREKLWQASAFAAPRRQPLSCTIVMNQFS